MSGITSATDLATIYQVVTTGLGGIGLVGFVLGWIVPGWVQKRTEKDRDQWRAAYEKERDAHQATRDAYAAASQRGDAGVEAAKVTVSLIDALRGTERRQIERRTTHGDD